MVACVGVQGAELHLILCSHDLETQHFLNKGWHFHFSLSCGMGPCQDRGVWCFFQLTGPQAADWSLGQNCIPSHSLHHSYLFTLPDTSEQSSCPEIPIFIVRFLLISFCSEEARA